MSRGSKQQIACACGCGRTRMVRTADVKRGWGKYFNKSCKARHQEKRTGGQYRRYLDRQDFQHDGEFGVSMEAGYFGHGQE